LGSGVALKIVDFKPFLVAIVGKLKVISGCWEDGSSSSYGMQEASELWTIRHVGTGIENREFVYDIFMYFGTIDLKP